MPLTVALEKIYKYNRLLRGNILKKTQASTSAQGIAYVRAFETNRPPAERICNDPYARLLISPGFYLLGKLFAGYAERKGPGVLGFLATRCRYIDDYLLQCLETGLEQVIILGAGLDSRPYRFEHFRADVKAFEVDHPVTQRLKLDKLKKIFGEEPSYVTYVPIDFNFESLDKLFEFGYSRQLKTLFIWEGVVHYLSAEAVDRTLEFVCKNSMPGSSIIFDYLYTSALTATQKRGEIIRMQRTQRYTGEGLIFGIEEGKVEEFLSARGFIQITNVTTEDLKRRYFTGLKQSRTIAPIYAIVSAVVP